MSIKHVVESKYFVAAAFISGLLLVALISFGVGVKVGAHKAFFSARFGENYERNFLGGDERRDQSMKKMANKMMDKGMRSGHGVAGEILSVNDQTLIIKDRDNQEVTVRLNEMTTINRGKESVTQGTLLVGDRIVVVGKPGEDGVIAAALIRIFPAKLLQ